MSTKGGQFLHLACQGDSFPLVSYATGHGLEMTISQCFMLETLHQSPQSETSARNSVPKTIS